MTLSEALNCGKLALSPVQDEADLRAVTLTRGNLGGDTSHPSSTPLPSTALLNTNLINKRIRNQFVLVQFLSSASCLTGCGGWSKHWLSLRTDRQGFQSKTYKAYSFLSRTPAYTLLLLLLSSSSSSSLSSSSFFSLCRVFILKFLRQSMSLGNTAILLFLFMVLISLVSVLNLLYFYISTFLSICVVPNMAVFCNSLT